MKILHKAIATGVIVYGECHVVGVELNHTSAANLPVYNAGTADGAELFATLRVTATSTSDSIMFPLPGIKCDNVYGTLSAGNATLYYYL